MKGLLTALGGDGLGFLDVRWGERPDEGQARRQLLEPSRRSERRGPPPAFADPYAIPGVSSEHRDGVKKLFASLTFGPAALEGWPRGCRKLFPRGTCRETVINLLRRHHAPVADRLGTLIGFELQRTEGDILVAVLLTCFERGVIVLPIHDAVLCPVSRVDEVEAVMLGAFKKGQAAHLGL
ncbi:MAG TPA: hypothetical protein VKF35_04680 [Hyphomicrobiaceae bacterium]|nr:hypothetical protein [Hyphomicrobiaceae bacterium]